MVLERDYPMTRRDRRALVLGFVVLGVIGLLLFGGLIPGLKPETASPSTATLDGTRYYVDSVVLTVPILTRTTPSWNETFRNVSFDLHAVNWYNGSGVILRGNGTAASGGRIPFELGELLPNGSRASMFVSPGGIWGVAWIGGWFEQLTIELLVETSYSPGSGSP
jgi:hypothetical protein